MTFTVWCVNAFTSDAAGGNPTAVVVLHEPIETSTCAAIARRLRVPDTVFLRPDAPATWRARFFSPLEGEMSFCGQGLLAGAAVLREQHVEDGVPQTMRTQTADVRLSVDASDRHWMLFPRERVRRSAATPAVVTQFGLDADQFAPQDVVDSGRNRVFVRAARPDILAGLRITPPAVLEYCERNQVSGVCFFAQHSDEVVALRVFTRSLGGEEDVSTGGAVLGLASLLEPREWRIEQGHGSFLRRGTLFVRNTSDSELALGGHTEITVRGVLDL
jgi:PhzF family phenazine biosynthesis protein